MSMTGTILTKADISQLTAQLMIDGKLQIMPYAFYQQRDWNEIANFMVQYGIYCLPTLELIDYLKSQIIGPAIEIGSGKGAIGRALNIPMTDNKMQSWPHIIKEYEKVQQPVIDYPNDIIEFDAVDAITYFKPITVVGSFITHKFNGIDGNMYGVDHDFLLSNCKRYIHIGNLHTHRNHSSLSRTHIQYYFPWVITRSMDQSLNRIFVFNQ